MEGDLVELNYDKELNPLREIYDKSVIETNGFYYF
jgi:hypothetical protein